jgi:hypothetical protein
MKTIYLNTDKSKLEYALNKAITQAELQGELCRDVFSAVESVKHHKKITKRLLEELSYHGSLERRPSWSAGFKLTVYFDRDKRIYSTSKPDKNGVSLADYHDAMDITIYFESWDELQEQALRLNNSYMSHAEAIGKELDNLDDLIKRAESLAKEYNALVNNLSYTLKCALNL